MNLLGKREVDIYGNQDFKSFFEELKVEFQDHELSYFQSNHEGNLIDHIQNVGFEVDGIVLNPAGFSHTSIALADAVAAIPAQLIEVHISNIFARESYRTHSYISSVASGVITGLGLDGYRRAIQFLIDKR